MRQYEIYSNYLEHHGILGQKWGVRRFQNKDGTLTQEGKERYYADSGSATGKLSKSAIDGFEKIGFKHINNDEINGEEIFYSVDKYEGTKYAKNNCVMTSTSYTLNELGISNSAARNESPILKITGKRRSYNELMKAFPGSKYYEIDDYTSASDIRRQMLEKFPDGACGIMGASDTDGFGHSISWKIKDRAVIFADSQMPSRAVRELKRMNPDLSDSESQKIAYDFNSNISDSALNTFYNNYSEGAAFVRLDTVTGVNEKYARRFIEPK